MTPGDRTMTTPATAAGRALLDWGWDGLSIEERAAYIIRIEREAREAPRPPAPEADQRDLKYHDLAACKGGSVCRCSCWHCYHDLHPIRAAVATPSGAGDASGSLLAPAKRGGERHLFFNNGRSEDYEAVVVQHESGEWDRILIARDDGTVAQELVDLINGPAARRERSAEVQG